MTSSADQVGKSDEGGASTPPEITHDVAFDLLSNRRRRFVLNRLQGADEGVEIGDIATELAAMENDSSAEELSRKERKRVYVSLYQTHVPKLEEAGVVTYDSDSGIVRPTDRILDLAAYFRSDTPSEPGAVLVGLLALGGFGLYTLVLTVRFQPVAPVDVGVGLLLTGLALGLAHYARAARRKTDGPSIPVETE